MLNWKKIGWLVCMGMLCLALVAVVSARVAAANNYPDNMPPRPDQEEEEINQTTPTPSPIQDEWPDIDITQTQYTMVRDGSPLSAAWAPDCEKISGTNNQLFDVTALPHLEKMLEDCRAAGFTIYVTAAYRSYSYQNNLFNSKASQIAIGMGLTGKKAYLDPKYQEAAEEAKKIVMFPGRKKRILTFFNRLSDFLFVLAEDYASKSEV